MPCAWTVAYQVAKLPDAQFETLAASGKLRPELSEKEVRKFIAQRAAAVSTRTASDELAYLSAKMVFPALLSLEREDAIRQKIFDVLITSPTWRSSISERRKLNATRK